ncbi:Metallo-dependent phosphatase-like protein [Rhodofomes roseus]|uniref:Metallo-dependent phosphatase-like protein n=1 Tax=Rhodofomes roseus TaxID=34475 RepID=A0ABQ8KAJ6_9APHY|nr:Metallo-dependent phosphatase-like protein [Rhodofomes roseus]KAH9833841.1 Metallo-dependent phosphatase-like protein [Rhodofomes roseus]
MPAHSPPDDAPRPPRSLRSPTAVVHLEYDSTSPPPPPSPEWTRFVCISDTHSRMVHVPPGDVLLHSGDLTAMGTYADFQRTMDWLCDLPHRTKIIIAGNHDLPLDYHDDWYVKNYDRWHGVSKQSIGLIQDLIQGRRAAKSGIVYLEDDHYEFCAKPDGRKWTVYGSPWSPYFHNWAFNYQRGEEAEKLMAAVPKTDILLTHTPPHDILDKTTVGNEHVGCEALAARLPALRPRLHVFGHIHEDHGAVLREWPAPGSPSGAPLPDEGDAVAAGAASSRDAEQTVFVNAANWPMGPRACRPGGGRVQFGEAPFQPVIVDLLDDA